MIIVLMIIAFELFSIACDMSNISHSLDKIKDIYEAKKNNQW